MSFFIKASVEALKNVPRGQRTDRRRDFIQNNFLMTSASLLERSADCVPIVRDADKKSFADLERDIANYATKAREGK